MNAANDIRPRHRQQVVVAFQWFVVVGIRVTTKICFLQPMPLDHGAHRTIEDENALAQGAKQCLRPSSCPVSERSKIRIVCVQCFRV